MTERRKSKKRKWCKRIAFISVFIAAISVFSTKTIAQSDVKTLTNNEKITRGKGVSQALLTEYQEIVGKYLERYSVGNPNEIDKYYWKSDRISEENWKRLYAIYVQMTYEQQKEQMISFREPSRYFDRAFPPHQRSYDFWIEDPKCKIWIDGEKVDKSVLNSYKTTDFFRYFSSSLRGSDGRTDEYRVDLWTETGLKIFSGKFFEQPISIDKLLEIEPQIQFLVEKDDNKPTILYLNPEPQYGWMLSKITSISENGVNSTLSNGAPTPTTFHSK